MFDVAVIGAGMAGLVCAQQLAQAGYSVVVVEKSRGLGGRVATRRLHGTCADHGVRYLQPQGQLLQQFVQVLCERNILRVWNEYESQQQRYVAPAGMSAIAKFLATGLEIRLNQRVKELTLNKNKSWRLTLTDPSVDISELIAGAVVIAIPAPQALMLLEPLAENKLPAVFLEQLRSVSFDPCLSVIAGYPSQQHQPTWTVTFSDDPDLAWIGLDSSKRMEVGQLAVFVLHSSGEFAQHYLEAQDLQPAGQQLLTRAAQACSLPWLETPEWMQIHRWRYAFASHPLHEAYLSAGTSLPLVCCGDWCGGNQVEGAMLSGLEAAKQLNNQLQQRTLPESSFLNFLDQQT